MTLHAAPGPFNRDWILNYIKDMLDAVLPTTIPSGQPLVYLRVGTDPNTPSGLETNATENPGSMTYVLHTGKAASSLTPLDWHEAVQKLVRLVDTLSKKVPRFVINMDGAPAKIGAAAIGTAMMPSLLFPGSGTKSTTPNPEFFLQITEPGEIEPAKEGWMRAMLANVQRLLSACSLNILGITTFEAIIEAVAVRYGIEVIRPTTEEFERMRLLRAVNKGAAGRQARVLALRVDPTKGPTTKLIADLFKGLMYDDGGANHKPTEAIGDMEKDMSAAALGLMKMVWRALNRNKLKYSCLGVLVLAENRIDGDSYMTGDIIEAYDGRTVKITNTDAEGRLVLADAIAWVCERWKGLVKRLTTTATLTGHVLIALGNNVSGVMVKGNIRKLFDNIEDDGRAVMDPFHRLEVLPEDDRAMNGGTSDLKNATNAAKERGAQKGAAFLWQFVTPDVEQVIHFDVARIAHSGGPGLADHIPPPGGLWCHIETDLDLLAA